MSAIDWLVLTAANRSQARGYEAQLDARQRDGRLAGVRRWLVVPDPRNRRVGSGGSTFVVLHELAGRFGTNRRGSNPFDGQRILIIHSGGDSRRLPAYAAEGKVFVPLPRMLDSGQPATLFDLILADLTPLVRAGRVLIGSGDVLLGVGKHDFDFSSRGMLGVAFPGPTATGSRHGVYICDRAGEVRDFLQKPTPAQARARKALDRRGRVLIDTGVLSLDAAAALRWTRASTALVKKYRSGHGEGVDLYSELLPALYARGSREKRFERFRVPFGAAVIPTCDFLHIGSTIELLAVSTKLDSSQHRAVSLNSVVTGRLSQHSISFVEASRITHPSRIGNHGMLVGFPGGFPIRLDDHLGLTFLPVGRADWTCIAFGVRDDFKTPFGRGGTFCNKPRRESDLSDVTLWDLPAWAIGPVRSAFQHAIRQARQWSRQAGRPMWSMAELMPRVNVARLLANRQALQADRSAAETDELLRRGHVPPAHLAMAAAHAGPALARLARARLTKECNPFRRARLHYLIAMLDPSHAAMHDAEAFGSVASGVATASATRRTARRAAIDRNQVVTVTAPVRIDLCGGWSDTPPICHELGGTVVNTAITLDGRQPVRVTARLIDEPIYRLRSEDLGQSCAVATTTNATSHHDPHDWAALPKAALILAGITPRNGPLRQRLMEFGGGIELTMNVAVPKGSGLGTSSILGAAVLACLDRVCGRAAEPRSIIERTSILEQMMSTAGGWQDQAGGITPGFKILRTRPGHDQVPRISPIRLSPRAMREFRSRTILYYTGQRRLARDILQGVVRRYLSGDPRIIRIIAELKNAAEQMAKDLARGDIDAFARGVLRNWELKKAIDPGSSNPRIERILGPLVPRLSGYELAGAGGGGFIFMIARSTTDARAVCRLLRTDRTAEAGLVEFDIDQRGLNIGSIAANPE